MPVYLEFLYRRFLALGGVLRPRTLSTVNEVFAETDRVVNCTGLDARELCGDAKVFSARGQVVRVTGVKVARWVLDPPGPDREVSYIVPRSQEIVLGGTVEDYSEDRTPNAEVTQKILDRCTEFAPELSRCRIVTPKVGLRPCRSAVRLEIEEVDERHAVIHNYGHGGSGLTLSWGCAREVADLADGRWGVGR
jgi:D-amino-acid oxidase